jgi:hypothetical protein
VRRSSTRLGLPSIDCYEERGVSLVWGLGKLGKLKNCVYDSEGRLMDVKDGFQWYCWRC